MANTFDMSIQLKDLVFFREIPALLGITPVYARQLCCPPGGVSGDWFREVAFAKPRVVTASGIRIWWRSDLEVWAMDARRRANFADQRRVPLLDDRALADKMLGRAPRAR